MTDEDFTTETFPDRLRSAVVALVHGDHKKFQSVNRSLTGGQSYAVLVATSAAFVDRMWPNSEPSLEQLAEYSGRLVTQLPPGQVPSGYVEAVMREALGEEGATDGIATEQLIPAQILIIQAGSSAVVTDSIDRAELVDEVVQALLESLR